MNFSSQACEDRAQRKHIRHGELRPPSCQPVGAWRGMTMTDFRWIGPVSFCRVFSLSSGFLDSFLFLWSWPLTLDGSRPRKTFLWTLREQFLEYGWKPYSVTWLDPLTATVRECEGVQRVWVHSSWKHFICHWVYIKIWSRYSDCTTLWSTSGVVQFCWNLYAMMNRTSEPFFLIEKRAKAFYFVLTGIENVLVTHCRVSGTEC